MEKRGTDLAAAKQRAFELFQNNRLEEAGTLYAQLCERDPADARAWHTLGVIQGRLGDADGAEAACRCAIVADPRYGPAHGDLGNALYLKGRLDEALACYREAQRLHGGSVHLLNNIGTLLYELRRMDEAADCYRSALRLSPDAVIYRNLGNVLAYQQRLDEAAAMYTAALRLAPSAEACCRLANVLARQDKPDEAAGMYRECLKLDPGHAIARHMLAACTGGGMSSRAADDYIRHTFDNSARTFDKTLAGLGYRVPEAVAEILGVVFGAPRQQLDILDAGCGTGLCGSGLRPYARRLDGVDLSEGMLAKARQGGLYDRLVTAELTAFLSAAAGAYDLVVCADVLIYFGELDTVFAAAVRSLRAGGVLMASVEQAGDDAGGGDFHLRPHGRYGHTEAYARRALAEAGFSVDAVTQIELRKESGVPVPGLILVARTAA